MSLSIGTLTGFIELDQSGLRRGVAATQATMGTLGKNMSAQGIMAANGWVQGANGRLVNAKGKFVTSGEMAAAGLGQGIQKKSGLLQSAWAKAVGVIAVGQAVKSAVTLEATYSKTMAQISAATGAPKSDMAKMDKLAMKLGADTAFSAGEAANAMLELAKAGISTSDIMGGALSGTLTLAAAGGTDLATASTIAANAMNTFGLKGKDMSDIAAALAGGANASSASVESLGQALQQVGPGAKNAGLSLQETVGALSAFDAAGVKGSDAGTSLKTMLANLVPSSKSAKEAMKGVGLWTDKTGSAFVNADGSFKSMAQISGLLHDKLGDLSESQKSTALSTIFGSDASRAATVLMNEGSKGIKKYIKATKDKGAAEKMAKANMSGTAGALEKMGGSLETAGLALGKAFAPAVVKGSEAVGAMAEGVAKATDFLTKHKKIAMTLGIVIGALTLVVAAHSAALAVGAAGGLTAWLSGTRLVAAATKVWTAIQWALTAAMNANPIGLVVALITGLVVAVVIAYKKSETFRKIVNAAFNAVKKVVGAVFGFLKRLFTDFPGTAKRALSSLGSKVRGVFTGAMDAAKDAVRNGVEWVKDKLRGLPDALKGLGKIYLTAGKTLIGKFFDGLKKLGDLGKTVGTNLMNGVIDAVNAGIQKVNDFIPDKIPLPGLVPDINLPNNPFPSVPRLATGGRATAETLAVIGEGREPESVLPDSVLRGLLERAHTAGAQSAQPERGRSAPLIGAATFTDADPRMVAEKLWFLTRTRG